MSDHDTLNPSKDTPFLIFVCDDDDDVRAILAASLRRQGYQVEDFASANEVLTQCESTLPDLIVMDLMLPHMSGLEFVNLFRKRFPNLFLPILILTARSEIEWRVKGLREGADDYLTKPFDLKEFEARVSVLLRTKHLTSLLEAKKVALERANEELQETQAALLQRERELAVVQTAGAAAHRLRQPVTSVLLHCHLIERHLDSIAADDAAKEPLRAIRKECELMDSLLTKLNSVTGIQTENYVGDMKIVSLDSDTPPSDTKKEE